MKFKLTPNARTRREALGAKQKREANGICPLRRQVSLNFDCLCHDPRNSNWPRTRARGGKRSGQSKNAKPMGSALCGAGSDWISTACVTIQEIQTDRYARGNSGYSVVSGDM